MKVPVFDLSRARAQIEEQLLERWAGLLQSTAFVQGPEVTEFESAFADSMGAAGCVGVANGTDALTLALRALDIEAGDEILMPAFTFFATYESIVLAGAVPVVVDIDPKTYSIDLESAASRLSERTVGVVGVHLYGCPVDHAAMDRFCQEHSLFWVEDAAQAHGALSHGTPAGRLGSLASWSFYPSKNLGCFGDGGAVTSDDPELLERVRLFANHGAVGRYRHSVVGTNSRLDAVQAAVLNLRLPLLEACNQRRAEIVSQYGVELLGIGDLVLPLGTPGSRSANHLFTVRSARRDELKTHLAENGVGSAVHYPCSIVEQAAVACDGEPQEIAPNAMRAGREVLSLPLFPEMTDEEVALVCEGVKSFFD